MSLSRTRARTGKRRCGPAIPTEKLDKGHAKGITDAELRLFSCWIDLGVPFCGDYEEANLWDDADRARWKTCVEKRRRDCAR